MQIKPSCSKRALYHLLTRIACFFITIYFLFIKSTFCYVLYVVDIPLSKDLMLKKKKNKLSSVNCYYHFLPQTTTTITI